MPRYHYQALNAEGVSLEGMLRANNEREAARALERRGLSVVEVRSGETGDGKQRRGRLRTLTTKILPEDAHSTRAP